MAFDLDDEELRATRRDKGLDDVLYEETSDKNVGSIEDIRDLLLFLKSHGWIPDINRTVNITNVLLAIDNVLQEREQDKKRIQELEAENMQKDLEKIGIKEDTEANMKEIIEKFYTANEKCIPKQKVKDKIEELKDEFNKINTPENNEWYIDSDKYAFAEEKLQELLEDK